MKMIRIPLLISFAALVPVAAGAQSLSHVPAAFLDVGLDARGTAMAGANVVVARDLAAVVWNPAGLVSIGSSRQLMLSTTRQLGLVPYHLLVFGKKVAGTPAAVGATTSGDDVLRENSAFVAAARRVAPYTTAGIALKLYQASFGNNAGGQWEIENADRQVRGSAFGAGLDVGVRYVSRKGLAAALVAKNLFSSVSYNASNAAGTAKGGSESIPTEWIAGLGVAATRYTLFELDLHKATHADVRDRVAIGAEQILFGMFAVRAGYAQNLDAAQVERNVTVGGGLALDLPRTGLRVGLDVAYLITELQNFLHVSFRVIW